MNKAHTNINWKNFPSTDSPVNDENLNKMDVSIDEIDNRVISLDTTKATKTEVASVLSDASFNGKTGVFTFTRKNGSTFTVDTLLEKIIVNFDFDSVTQKLIIYMEDGTTKEVDLSAFATQYEFIETETISVQVSSEGEVYFTVKEGSIQEKHLRPDYLADIKVESAKAEASATSAASSATAAENSATAAKKSEENAKNIVESIDIVTTQKNGLVPKTPAWSSVQTYVLQPGGSAGGKAEWNAFRGWYTYDDDRYSMLGEISFDATEGASYWNISDENTGLKNGIELRLDKANFLMPIYEMGTSLSKKYLSLSGGTMTGELAIVAERPTGSITGNTPVSGALTESTLDALHNYKSFIGTVSVNSTWYNVISVRHRNGAGDGSIYGMRLRTALSSDDGLVFEKEINGSWKAPHYLLDQYGGNLVADLTRQVSEMDITQSNNGLSTSVYPTTFMVRDKNIRYFSMIQSIAGSDGTTGLAMQVSNWNSSGNAMYNPGGIRMIMDKSGTMGYAVTQPEKFRSAIEFSKFAPLLQGGIEIPENADLDSYTVPGTYYCRNTTIAKTIANRPTNEWFVMHVRLSDGVSSEWPCQELTEGNTGTRHYRVKRGSSGFSGWNVDLTVANWDYFVSIADNSRKGNAMQSLLNSGRLWWAQYGFLIHYANNSSSTAGYFKIATFTIKGAYRNAPIEFKFCRRGDSISTRIYICFQNYGNADPPLYKFYYDGQCPYVYLYKADTSTWDIYILKTERYDNCTITDFKLPAVMTDTIWNWKNELADSVPSGAVQASPLFGSAANYDIADSSVGSPLNKVAFIKGDGVMEVGKYIDFHSTAGGETEDYFVRLNSSKRNDRYGLFLGTDESNELLTQKNYTDYITKMEKYGSNGYRGWLTFDSLGADEFATLAVMGGGATNSVDFWPTKTVFEKEIHAPKLIYEENGWETFLTFSGLSSDGFSTYYISGNGSTSSIDFYPTKTEFSKPIVSSGGDYAEFWEWADGNPDDEDRVGHFVTFTGKFIRMSQTGDDLRKVAVVSAIPSIIGDSDGREWVGKYLRDVYGHILCETYTDEDGVERRRPMINPEWDETREYIKRDQRPEWDYVGTHGKLVVEDDGTCVSDGFCVPTYGGIATAADDGFYVMERLDYNHIRIYMK